MDKHAPFQMVVAETVFHAILILDPVGGRVEVLDNHAVMAKGHVNLHVDQVRLHSKDQVYAVQD